MWWMWMACGPKDDGVTDEPSPAEEYEEEGLDIIRSSFESPTWDLAGFALFTAPIGTVGSSFEESRETMLCQLPNHDYDLDSGWLEPIAQHAGPYGDEILEGVTTCGRVSRKSFSQDDLIGDLGLFLVFSMVPGVSAEMGLTTDSQEPLPLIGTTFLPIDVSADLVQNGEMFHPDQTQHGPRLDEINMGTKDGLSHWPLVLRYALNESPDHLDLTGDWAWDFTVTDEKGKGWFVNVPFTIE